jgi:hypothetical protein
MRKRGISKGGMGDQFNKQCFLQLIEGGLINKKRYKRGRLILLDEIKKGSTTIYLLGQKQNNVDVNEIEKYKMLVGYNGEIKPLDLRIVATKKIDSRHFFYLY